jgi:hypothetical protein
MLIRATRYAPAGQNPADETGTACRKPEIEMWGVEGAAHGRRVWRRSAVALGPTNVLHVVMSGS